MPVDELLFVYGTLRRNARCVMAHWLAAQGEYLGSGAIRGCIYDVGSYPALCFQRHPDEFVVGDIYRLIRPRYSLARLDRYEGIGPGQSRPYQYRREKKLVTMDSGEKRECWVYVYAASTAHLKRIMGGDYLQDGGPRQYRPVKVRRGAR